MDSSVTLVRDRFGALATVIALAVSLVVAVMLVFADVATAERLRDMRAFVSEAPPSGQLRGQDALSGSEWSPRSGTDHAVIMFGLAPAGQVGDAEFWRDVAARSLVIAPRTEFVGVCPRGESCVLPPGSDEELTLLSSMDPVQMRALAISARNGRALVYRGPLKRSIAITDDRQILADVIAGIATEEIRPGGA